MEDRRELFGVLQINLLTRSTRELKVWQEIMACGVDF